MAYAVYEKHPTEWEGWAQLVISPSGPGVYVAEETGAQVWLTETRHTARGAGTTVDPSTVVATLTVRADEDAVGSPRRIVDRHIHQHAHSAARPLIEAYNTGDYEQDATDTQSELASHPAQPKP